MRLLVDSDYTRVIKAENLEQIISENSQLLFEMEMTAISEMKSYLSQRYRVNEIFTNTSAFSISTPYNAKSLVYYTETAFDETVEYQGEAQYNAATTYNPANKLTYKGYIYTCILTSTGNLPTNPTYFTKGAAAPRVSFNGNIYESKTTTQGNLPTDTSKWTLVITDKTFFYVALPNNEWDVDTTYANGDIVFWQNKNYTAVKASAGLLPDENPEFWGSGSSYTLSAGLIPTEETEWTQGDNRNQLIVTHLTDIVLYHLLSRMPRNFSDIRKERYDGNSPNQTGGAIGWLKRVAKGEINADLPEIVTDPKRRIFYSSPRPKQNNFLW